MPYMLHVLFALLCSLSPFGDQALHRGLFTVWGTEGHSQNQIPWAQFYFPLPQLRHSFPLDTIQVLLSLELCGTTWMEEGSNRWHVSKNNKEGTTAKGALPAQVGSPLGPHASCPGAEGREPGPQPCPELEGGQLECKGWEDHLQTAGAEHAVGMQEMSHQDVSVPSAKQSRV